MNGLMCTRCGKPIVNELFVGDGDGAGKRFAHKRCFDFERGVRAVKTQEWAKRWDYAIEDINYKYGQANAEDAWAQSLGFGTAEEYHAVSDEAFSEQVREDADWEAW